jgi:hypothetical protein
MTNTKETKMNQLEIIARIIKAENIESGFVQNLRIIQMLTDSGLSFTLQPEVEKIIKNMMNAIDF